MNELKKQEINIFRGNKEMFQELSVKYENRYFISDEYENKYLVYTNTDKLTFKTQIIKFRDSKYCRIKDDPKVLNNKEARRVIDMFQKNNITVEYKPSHLFNAESFLKFYTYRNIEYIAVTEKVYNELAPKKKKYNRSKF